MAKTKLNENGYLVFEDGKLVHRWVAEKKHNTHLSENLDVHHINHHKKDNDKQNLIILKKEDHYDLHQYENKKELITMLIIISGFVYFVCFILAQFYNLVWLVPTMRVAVLFILILAIELKTNFVGQAIKRPHEKVFSDSETQTKS